MAIVNPRSDFPLLLASQSPRRRQLLEGAGFRHRALVPNVEEIIPERGRAKEAAMENAKLKGNVLRAELRDGELLVAADTVVILNEEAIGKPVDAADVEQILLKLSGRTHSVVTGLFLFSPQYGESLQYATSQVSFRKILPEEIARYVQLKEPYDKAGAYAVQGASSLFIDRIEGSFSNVMGLPLELLIQAVATLTRRSPFDLFEKL